MNIALSLFIPVDLYVYLYAPLFPVLIIYTKEHREKEEIALDRVLRTKYLDFRKDFFANEARDYKLHDMRMFDYAAEIVEHNLENEVETLFDEICMIGREEKVVEVIESFLLFLCNLAKNTTFLIFLTFIFKINIFKMRYMEQCFHESQNMKLEDTLEWVEIDIYEEFWSFFVPHMLNKMLEVVDFKKGMMEYAGMVKFSLSKNKKIDLNKAKETQV